MRFYAQLYDSYTREYTIIFRDPEDEPNKWFVLERDVQNPETIVSSLNYAEERREDAS